jgi:prophage tail gpP-like protein
LVDIKDDFLGIDTQRSQKFLITRVVFNLTENEGMTTTLDVIPPNCWRLETENDKEDPKKVIIKKNSSSSADFSWINKKQDFMSA